MFNARASSQSNMIGSNSVHSSPSTPQSKQNKNVVPPSPSTPTSLPPLAVSNSGQGRGRGTARGRGRGRGRGRSKGRSRLDLSTSIYARDLIPFIVPFVESYEDVIGDGNCGYRCVALYVYGDQELWPKVRSECCQELLKHQDLYQAVISYVPTDEVFDKIAWYGPDFAPKVHWLSLPTIGHIIATCYNVVLVSYSYHGACTCLPVIVPDGVGPPTGTIVLGHSSTAEHFFLIPFIYLQCFSVMFLLCM